MELRPWGLVLCVGLLVAGCASRGGIQTSGPSAEGSYVQIKREVTNDQVKAARSALKGKSVKAETLDHYLAVAQWEFNQGEYDAAARSFQRIAEEGPQGESTLRAQYMVGESHTGGKQFLAALSSFHKVLERDASSPYGKQARQRMEFLVKYPMDAESLAQYVSNYPESPLRCEALFQLGRRQADAGRRVEAAQTLKDYLAACPSHPQSRDAAQMLQGLEVKSAGKVRKVGVLAPLTGSYAGFGKDLLEGIRLAVEKANQTSSSEEPIELLVRDTAGDSVEALKAAKTLILQDGVVALLGPVAGSETTAVAALANQERCPILCPAASRDTLSSIGPYVFRNSMTNEGQGRALAQYAVDKMGLRSFAIVSPQDAYGEVLADSFRKKAESMGASIVASASYPPNSTDFRQALTALGGRNPSIDKENERENQRREQQLVYNMKREFLKALLPVTGLGSRGATLALACAPFAEAYGSTLCPSVQALVTQAAAEGWEGVKNPIRNQELVGQAMTRLPEDVRLGKAIGTSEQWGEVLDDLQAGLLVSGVVVSPSSAPGDESWQYQIRFETHFRAPDSARVRSSAVPLTLSEYKKPELLQKSGGFQAFYLPAHTGEIPSLASQLRFYGLKSQFLGGHTWENESVLRDGGDTVEGAVFVTGFWVDSPKDNVKAFVNVFAARYGRRPNLLSAQAYDAALLLAQALRGAEGREEARAKLSGIQGFDGVSGETSFNGTGNAEKKVPVLRIEGKKLKQLQ